MSSYSLPQTFRSTAHRVSAILVWSVAAGLTAWTALRLGPAAAVPWCVVCGMLSWWSWVLLWQPRVHVTKEYVDIINPFYRSRVPAESISEVSTQYQYAVVVDGKRHYAWALPAPGFLASASMGLRPGQQKAGPLTNAENDSHVRLGDVSGSPCSAASEVTKSVVPETPAEDVAPVTTTIDWKVIVITTVATLSVLFV